MKNLFKRIASVALALVMILLAIPTMEAQASDDVLTVHFKNTDNWSEVYVYSWGGTDGEIFGSWPGTPVAADATDANYFSVEIPNYKDSSLNIIFNGGKDQPQTVDILLDLTKGIEWWIVPTDNGSGKWAAAASVSKADAETGKSTGGNATAPGAPSIPENPTVKQSPVINGNEVTFYFESTNSNNVVISGSMNDWSTDWTMKKDGNVFSYTTTLKAGVYQYKYIVDGNWMTDPFNTETVNDESGNTNSTFTVVGGSGTGDTGNTGNTAPSNPPAEENKFGIPENPTIKESPAIKGNIVTFYFESTTAKNIVISGSMNGWTTDWTMTKDGNVFSYTTTLEADTYQYKYIVDGEWTVDPFNKETVQDEGGNTNSTFTVTGTTTPDTPSTNPDKDETNTTEDQSPSTDDKNDSTTDNKDDASTGAQPMSDGVILVIAIVAAVVVVLGGFAGYMYYKKKNA